MKQKVLSETTTKEIVTGARVEQSIFWIDPETQMLCKCRPDIWHDNFIVDLKTTEDASEAEFRRSIAKYGYHIQLGMIQEGLKHQENIDMRNFLFLAQEKKEPNLNAVYQLDEESIAIGIQEFKETLWEIKECHEKDYFPGYSTKMISLPAWRK